MKDQANDDRIYRKRNNVYFILVSSTNSRMHNAMLLAFGESSAEPVGCDKVKWA